jgi:hypothetical protein
MSNVSVMMAPAIAAAAAQKEVTTALRVVGATSPERATPIEGADGKRRGAVKALLRTGVVVQASPGRYWLDEAQVERRNRAARPAALAAIIGLLLICVAALVVLMFA